MNIQQDQAHKQRRDFIRQSVHARGFVSFEEIRVQGAKASPPWATYAQTFRDDEKYFEKHGLDIVRDTDKYGKGRFIYERVDGHYTYRRRLYQNRSEKVAIGQVGACLLLGLGRKPKGGVSRDEVLGALDRSAAKYGRGAGSRAQMAKERVQDKLRSYFSKPHRLCAIDAGTTNAYTTKALKKPGLMVPDPDTDLASLTILTNCPKIANYLLDPRISIGLLMLGGRLRKATSAFAGDLTQRCLVAMDLRPDIAMIGTTSLASRERFMGGTTDYELRGFYSDSEEESRTKSDLLHQSALRIVMMDSSKLDKERTSAFIFAPASDKHVDLVVTAEPVDDQKREHFRQCLKALWKTGVATIVAEPLETVGAEAEELLEEL